MGGERGEGEGREGEGEGREGRVEKGNEGGEKERTVRLKNETGLLS